MSQANITWSHNLKGGSATMKTYTTTEAVKAGDVAVFDSGAKTVSRMDAADEFVVGVAVGDTDSGDDVQVILATADDVFEFTSETTGFTTGTHNGNKYDFSVFTSGSFGVNCGTGDGDVLCLELVDGETSASAGNRFLGVFQTRVI